MFRTEHVLCMMKASMRVTWCLGLWPVTTAGQSSTSHSQFLSRRSWSEASLWDYSCGDFPPFENTWGKEFVLCSYSALWGELYRWLMNHIILSKIQKNLGGKNTQFFCTLGVFAIWVTHFILEEYWGINVCFKQCWCNKAAFQMHLKLKYSHVLEGSISIMKGNILNVRILNARVSVY